MRISVLSTTSGNNVGIGAFTINGLSNSDPKTEITMTATTATDSSGVEYYFTCVSGAGHDSGWQDSAVYTDTGLVPNTEYSYTVIARDKSANQNTTAPSVTASATTASLYDTWSGGGFDKPFTDTAPTSNPDGDGMNNLMEFAFGTDPTLNDTRSLVADGTVNGLPIPLYNDANAKFDFLFVRRKDYLAAGITYTPQFSSDLGSFDLSPDGTPTIVVEPANSDYEVVGVEFPAGARFGRVEITETP